MPPSLPTGTIDKLPLSRPHRNLQEIKLVKKSDEFHQVPPIPKVRRQALTNSGVISTNKEKIVS
jgi:hypothetical protein